MPMKIVNRDEVKEGLMIILKGIFMDGAQGEEVSIGFNSEGEANASSWAGEDEFRLKQFRRDEYPGAEIFCECSNITMDEYVKDLDSDADYEAEELLKDFERNHEYCVANKNHRVIETFETYAEAQMYCDSHEDEGYIVSVV